MAARDPDGDADSPAAGQSPPPTEVVTDVVTDSSAAALILEVPSERIVAASASAQRMLAPDGEVIVGRGLEDFTEDEPTGALPLLVAGRLNGYEARRVLRRSGPAARVRIWIRRLGDPFHEPRFVLAVLAEEDRAQTAVRAPRAGSEEQFAPAVGTTNARLYIDRISADVEDLLGYPPGEAIGRSLLDLVVEEDAAALLGALAQAVSGGAGVALAVRANRAGGEPVPCQMLIVPLAPPPTFGFALLPGDELLRAETVRDDMAQLLWQLTRGVQAVAASRGSFGPVQPDRTLLSRLTSRELEIIARLRTGDRVPAIATSLFLSQSTVRSHLAAAFRKLGVSSQQELIALLRKTDGSPS
jgi:DNA-binding CsgD family transcriptional regulator